MRPPASTKWRCQYTVGSLCRAAIAMIRLRCTTADPLAVMIRPPFGEPANAATVRSISVGSRTSIGVISILKYGATAWMAPNCPAARRDGGIADDAGSRHARSDLLQHFKPFSAH